MTQLVPREDIRRAAGRSIMCGFDGTSVTSELKEILREVRPLGVVLFARNVESPEQVAELNRELKELRAQDPLLIAVDQEGGKVARVRAPATEWPPMRLVGETGDIRIAEQLGVAIARELRAMNFDVNFAPVLDVDTNPDNPVIGSRSFSDDPATVAHMGAAMAKGMQSVGVAACGKHFPGHGDTDVDSHLALPSVEHDLARLKAVEWPPFREAIDAGISAIMTAHVVVKALDEDLPATLSHRALAPLRQELGFAGVVVSDDIEMKAVASNFSTADIAHKGMNAGVDVFLACHEPSVILELYRGLVQGIEREDISHERLLKAERRGLAWRERFYAPAVEAKQRDRWIGCGEHAKLVASISSMTI